MEWLRNLLFGSSRSPQPASTSPPRLKGNGKYSVQVVGESFYEDSYKAAFGNAIAEDPEDTVEVDVELALEDENPHDRNAVSVTYQGYKLGHLSRKMATEFRQALNRDGLSSYRRFRVGAEVYLGGDEQQFSTSLDLPEK